MKKIAEKEIGASRTMKKVLIVTTVSGFVPQFEMNNVKILQELGYEIHYASNFYTPVYGEDNERINGTNIICHQIDFVRSPFRIRKNYKALKQLKELMKKEQFELIHCHTPMGGVLGRLAAKMTGTKPVIYTVHGFHFYTGAPLRNWILYYPVEWWLAHYTDILITINQEDYIRAQKFHLRQNKAVWKINGVGIETKQFQGIVINKDKIQDSIGIDKKQLLLLSVGELNKNKNHKIVIQALARSNIKAYYIICGEGKERGNLEKLIQKKNLKERVFLLGYRKDVTELLKTADVFILPSRREGLSLSLQEAMACGLPVIVSKIRGNRELVTEKKGGWFIKPNDVKALTKIIENLKNEDLKAMGNYNSKKIAEYDKSEVISKMKKIYGSIAKETV